MWVRLNGKTWKFRTVNRLSNKGNQKGHITRGECDDPDALGKEIRILSSLSGKEKLEIVLHESLHAVFWFLAEEVVARVAEDLANFLWRLGLRWEDEESD